MINENTLNTLLKWKTFETNVHLAANQLKISDSDAQQELLNELINHRFNRYTASQLSELVKAHDTNLGWSITYGRLDLVSKHFKSLGKRAEMEHAAELEDVSTGIIKLADDNGNETSISEFKLQQVVSMFPTDKTRLFVDLTLRYGRTECQSVLKLTNKQYQRRLRNATSYVNRNRSKFDLVTSVKRDNVLYVLNSLNELEAIIDETRTGSIQDWINGHIKLVNELLADSDVRFQASILNHWETASKSDQYAFIRQTIKEQAKSQAWIDQSNEAIRQAGEAQSN
ncbi:hypothetical protein Lp90_1602 [Lactiplantibacillus plantarum]|uniref:hypothetical protein n=1 Tax=Lactiplantibacillus plantarum TaxID=1590 RepID=UPI0004DCF3EC|nr:hypothetical protein [Lactiplantibacillus plantarum]KEZ14020.1 hypothetical protein Lp90_1602 [Lactiplantibacillus plantarum]